MEVQTTTICAIATPIGRGGVGVIRLSGSLATSIYAQLCKQPLPAPRQAAFRRFLDAQGQCIDEGIVLYFEAPHSFTGEDVIELQGHGGRIVQTLLLERLYALGGVAAAPGEFSARAFHNEKLDLAQAEAIADLIDAQSEAAARSAVRSLQGVFSEKVQQLLEQLIHVRLYVEAAIDFPDEEVDFLSDGVILSRIHCIKDTLDDILRSAKQGQLLREGLHVVIAGKPNAGKSSLLNALAGTERAIVTDVAGTTRDVLHERIVLGGLPLTLTDTAGLRQTQDIVEQIGVERARTAIADADLLLIVYDSTENTPPLSLAQTVLANDDTLLDPKKVLLIANKADESNLPIGCSSVEQFKKITLSAKYRLGLDALTECILDFAHFAPTEDTYIARTRHLEALRKTLLYILEAEEQLVVYNAGELVAESLRLAQQALGEITGQFSADDLLGKIFSSFCIGK